MPNFLQKPVFRKSEDLIDDRGFRVAFLRKGWFSGVSTSWRTRLHFRHTVHKLSYSYPLSRYPPGPTQFALRTPQPVRHRRTAHGRGPAPLTRYFSSCTTNLLFWVSMPVEVSACLSLPEALPPPPQGSPQSTAADPPAHAKRFLQQRRCRYK